MKRRAARTDEDDDWSIGDIWLGVLFLVTGCLVVGFVVLWVRNGLSGFLLLVGGMGGVLVGPILILLGGNAIVRALWSARPRSFRDVIEDERAERRWTPPNGTADRSDCQEERRER